MEVILLERIARLGGVGDVVKVKDGFGRNYLLPQKKALRANKANRELFESQRETLEKRNADQRTIAEKRAAEFEGVIVNVVRQASEDGKLYGSVAVRDVADALKEAGHDVDRRLIDLTTSIKSLGLYDVTIRLHPEVRVKVKVHVARNADSPIPQELLEDDSNAEAVAVEAAASADATDEAAE